MRLGITLFFIGTTSIFGFGEVPSEYQGLTRDQVKMLLDEVKTTQSAPVRTKIIKKDDSKKLKKLQSEIERLKGINNFNPTFGNDYPDIPTLARFKGKIDGNIISMGQPVSFKVHLLENSKFPPESYLSCTGSQLVTKYNYRLISSCDLLVTSEGEFKVTVGIKDIKKVDGIEADEAYTGEEEALLGEGLTGIMAALIDVKKDRVQTLTGFADIPNANNAILNGLLGGVGAVNSKVKEHTNNKSVVMAIYDQTEVVVEFKRRFKYESD